MIVAAIAIVLAVLMDVALAFILAAAGRTVSPPPVTARRAVLERGRC